MRDVPSLKPSCAPLFLSLLIIMASSKQIDQYMRTHRGDLPWLGVYASDTLPTITSKLSNGCLISNYDPSWKAGSHWIGLRIDKGRRMISYFDSYGNAPDKDDSVVKDHTMFTEYIKKLRGTFGYRTEWSHVDFQSLFTDVCGLYAIYFCLNGEPSRTNPAWKGFSFYTPDVIRNGQAEYNSGTNPGKLQNDRLIRKLVNIGIPVLDPSFNRKELSTQQDIGI